MHHPRLVFVDEYILIQLLGSPLVLLDGSKVKVLDNIYWLTTPRRFRRLLSINISILTMKDKSAANVMGSIVATNPEYQIPFEKSFHTCGIFLHYYTLEINNRWPFYVVNVLTFSLFCDLNYASESCILVSRAGNEHENSKKIYKIYS